MQNNHPYFSDKPMPPFDDQTGYYMQNAHISSIFDGFIPPGIKPRVPFSNIDIQPSAACPKNYIIFDQTDNRSQVMFHPDISSKLFNPGLETSIFQENAYKKDENDDGKISSTLKEDSDDIDALLSTEYEEENEESEDEVMSTARTDGKYEYDSSDSCSNYETVSRKTRKVFGGKSSGGFQNGKKRERMRKMVKALRGIVPGGNRMSNVAVLDEAVRYLKSLRMEVKKMGVEKNSQG